jgi:hypothetical protein
LLLGMGLVTLIALGMQGNEDEEEEQENKSESHPNLED